MVYSIICKANSLYVVLYGLQNGLMVGGGVIKFDLLTKTANVAQQEGRQC